MKRRKEKKYLEQIKRIDSDIIDMQADANRWRAIAESSTAFQGGERVQSSGNKDKMGGAADIFMDIEREIAVLVEKRKSIIAMIRSLPPSESGVLYKRYVLDKDYYEIADAYGMSYSWATTTHGKGLEMIQKILNEREANV